MAATSRIVAFASAIELCSYASTSQPGGPVPGTGSFAPDDAGYISCPATVEEIPLNADNAEAFVCWAAGPRDPRVVPAIDAARGDEAALAALFRVLEKVWMRDDSPAMITLKIIQQLRDPMAMSPLEEHVWRTPIADSNGDPLSQAAHLEMLEATAADALVCINTDESNQLVAQIIASHPYRMVRDEARSRQVTMRCGFFDF